MAYLATSNTQQTSVSLYIGGLNTTSQYTEIYITSNGRTSPNLSRPSGNSSSLFWSVTGLSPGNQYYASYTLRTSAGSTGSGDGWYLTESVPLPDPPSAPSNVRVYDRGPGFIGVTWNSVSSADGYSIEFYHSATGSLIASDYGFSSTAKLMSGLTTGVSYDIKVWAFNAGGNSSGTWLYGIKAGNIRPSNWTGFNGIASGQYVAISASTWNSFVTRIKDFYTYRDLNPTLFPFTAATSGSAITATQINQARNAISYLGPSVPSAVSTGGIAYASTIVGLQTSLNSVT